MTEKETKTILGMSYMTLSLLAAGASTAFIVGMHQRAKA